MKTDETWVVFEVEASGMKRPLYAVEIAAQRMRGYEPDGIRFESRAHVEVEGGRLAAEEQALRVSGATALCGFS